MSVKKFTFFLCPAFAIFCRNILGFFKNRSRRTRVDKHILNLKSIVRVISTREGSYKFPNAIENGT